MAVPGGGSIDCCCLTLEELAASFFGGVRGNLVAKGNGLPTVLKLGPEAQKRLSQMLLSRASAVQTRGF